MSRKKEYTVVLLNDDDTTYNYVVIVLHKIFKLPLEQAVEITLEADILGHANVGEFSAEEANRLVGVTMLANVKMGMNLRFRIEKND